MNRAAFNQQYTATEEKIKILANFIFEIFPLYGFEENPHRSRSEIGAGLGWQIAIFSLSRFVTQKK